MNQRTITVRSCAKINLSLNITGVCGHLHTLDMVLASVDLADVIAVSTRSDNTINVVYRGADIQIGSDSVSLAAAALQNITGRVFGADITVEKRIPVAAGLGGSGVDAAGAIAALDRLYGFGEDACRAAAEQSGSDVPYLLHGGFARVRGMGESAMFFGSAVQLYAVIANGAQGVLSKDSYRMFDEMYPDKTFCPTETDALIAALLEYDKTKAYCYMDNALYKPSLALNPEIGNTLSALETAGAEKSLMTGSGSACVGFFDSLQTAALAADRLKVQGVWARAVTTQPKGIEFL